MVVQSPCLFNVKSIFLLYSTHAVCLLLHSTHAVNGVKKECLYASMAMPIPVKLHCGRLLSPWLLAAFQSYRLTCKLGKPESKVWLLRYLSTFVALGTAGAVMASRPSQLFRDI